MNTHDAWQTRTFCELNKDAIDFNINARDGICSGNCNQGRTCNCAPYEAASCCTEIGADGVPSIWESADAEVMAFFGRVILVAMTVSVSVFSALFLSGMLSSWMH